VSTTAPALRFRHSSAITVAAVISMITALSFATWAPYLLVLLALPLAVAVWSWRSGTDVDQTAVTVRAALGSRRMPWPDIAEIVPDEHGRVFARLRSGSAVRLTAVGPGHLAQIKELLGLPAAEAQ
jgi:Bacterial PH domain